MNSKTQRITSVLALFVVFCLSQVYVGLSFAGPGVSTATSDAQAPTQDSAGILTTVGNKAITVNGTSAVTGTTILTGASIETPDGVRAIVSLGKLGSLEIEQKAKLTLSFADASIADGSIKVMLLEGCVILRANKGTVGEIETSKGVVGKTDPKTGGVLRVCHPDSVLVASAVAAGGLSKWAILAVISGPAAVIIPILTPGNPSNSNPR